MSFVIAGNSASTGYNLTRSLRFRASASATLSRTPASASNRKTWTWSGWVKRGSLSTSVANTFLSAGYSSAPWFVAQFGTDQKIEISFSAGVSNGTITNAVFRDPSAWYHIVISVDTTQATASNRLKLYVNNVEQTFSSTNYPSQNYDGQINNTTNHAIGGYSGQYFDGYLAETNFIDGQALTPSSFGSTNSVTGVWQPARYTGTYGTNGFYLPFTDNSTAAALGTDFSGNSNTWTTNNISVTAGVTYDSMTDVPTLTSATAANFAVLNPLENVNTSFMGFQNGNLRANMGTGAVTACWSSMVFPSGKFYFEITITLVSNGTVVGISYGSNTTADGSSKSISYTFNGDKNVLGTTTAYGATYTTGDVIGIAVDTAAGTVTFYKNNASQGVITNASISAQSYRAWLQNGTSGASSLLDINFGQRPFTYTPPTGFVALNTFNLPTSTIVKGNTVMDATLYTANASTQVITNAAGFKPDFVWTKSRTGAYSHQLWDSIRGVNTWLQSNSTTAEQTGTAQLTSFNSNGFTLGANENSNYTNGYAAVGWQWQAGQGTNTTNTNGTITSTVSVNASAGFSVVTYTGTGANATVGHGLGVAPSMVIVKRRDAAPYSWIVWQSALAGTEYLILESTNAKGTAATVWNSTVPTSSVFSLGSNATPNSSGGTYVAYCWSQIAGYSAFGSYTGNGSTDGPFVYLGFRPKYLLVKSSSLAQNWTIFDSSRNPYNAADLLLYPQYSNAENQDTGQAIDLISNGFKVRNSNANENTNGATYIYIAYAENPFKNALAR